MPPPPQEAGAEQTPQLSVPPQPSLTVPQLAPSEPQVRSVQLEPHVLGELPPPQTSGAEQLLQERRVPQPSPGLPQLAPSEPQVCGWQLGPQMFGTPFAPQTYGGAQVPHDTSPPQPSAMVPQFLPCCTQVVLAHEWQDASQVAVFGGSHCSPRPVSTYPSPQTEVTHPPLPLQIRSAPHPTPLGTLLPVQEPFEQTSAVVQTLASSHEAVLFACAQPVAGAQVSVVHSFWSSQLVGAPPQVPVVHMSPVVQAFPSLQLVPSRGPQVPGVTLHA